MTLKLQSSALVVVMAFSVWSCSHPTPQQASLIDCEAVIYPDYTGITVPPNIAPLNFRIDSDGARFVVDFVGDNGYRFTLSTSKNAVIPMKKWRRLMRENLGQSYQVHIYRKQDGAWEKFPPIVNTISRDSIDPYLIYRLVHPGYETAGFIRIQQRHLETFDHSDIVNNGVAMESCMNCHITNGGNPDQFVIHFRFKNSGTVIYKDGEFRRLNTVTPEFNNPGIHPAWHPSGRFIAFSTNTAELFFHSDVVKRTESYDSKGNIALLDLETNTMLATPKLFTPEPLQETFPCWSPDGKYLYFCRVNLNVYVDSLIIQETLHYIQYDLLRIPFDAETISFGDIEMVVDAEKLDRSISLPRISPDGRYVMFCVSDRGTFTVWKKESDLYMLDLETFEMSALTAANSDDSESYHSWSSNSKWFVVSSKRRNGFVALPHFAHIDSNGVASKAFLLPQKDPNFYETWIRSFNVPELAKGKTTVGGYDFERVINGPIIKVGFGWTNDTVIPNHTSSLEL